VLAPDELHAHARARASALAALPPASVRITKRLIGDAGREAVRAALEREGEVFFERLRSPEAAEAMKAFFERRAPDFSRFE
jgi:enoyl-CoA hydratase/carnithine racemase